MKTCVMVNLNKISDIKNFQQVIKKYLGSTLESGSYVVDANSVLGILSLDLSKPVMCKYEAEDIDEAMEFTKDINIFKAEVLAQ